MDDAMSFPDHLVCATCDHEIACPMNTLSITLQACYVKKVPK